MRFFPQTLVTLQYLQHLARIVEHRISEVILFFKIDLVRCRTAKAGSHVRINLKNGLSVKGVFPSVEVTTWMLLFRERAHSLSPRFGPPPHVLQR